MKTGKILLHIFLFLFFANFAFFVEAVENSIVLAIEQSEVIEKLPVQKYSKNQLSEIISALQHKEECLRIVSFNMLANETDHKRIVFYS